VFLFLVVFALAIGRCSSVNDCHSVRYAYLAKGLDLKDVPRQPRQGSQLEICPRGLTCCTEEMERKLRSVSKEQYGKAISSAADSMQRYFNNRANKFNDVFLELLSASKLNFHRLFRKTYGIIYIKNSDVFIDFFKDLESYYDQGQVDLDSALNRFFTSLYQRMFTVYNAQYKFDSRYLTCVSQTMKSLQPFGDVPQKLNQQLRRSFVATRTFNQALINGKYILNRIVKIQPRDRCVRALTKMSSCPACEGFTEIKPCSGYCVNVMKGCLAYHTEFGRSWDKFLENLRELAARLNGPYDIEDVVDPIGVKISEAIMNFQRSGFDVSQKVIQQCGQPRIQKREAPYYTDSGVRPRGGGGSRRSRQRAQRRRNNNKKRDKVSKLKTLINGVKDNVADFKGFWTKLPYDMCKDDHREIAPPRNRYHQQPATSGGGRAIHSGGSADKCWDGQHAAAEYGAGVVRDGLVHQEYNPEVSVDVGKVDREVKQQMNALKSITKKMVQAIKGEHVDWRRINHEDSGDNVDGQGPRRDFSSEDYHNTAGNAAGSGDCYGDTDDEDCYQEGGSVDDDDDGSGGYGSDEYGDSVDDDYHQAPSPPSYGDHHDGSSSSHHDKSDSVAVEGGTGPSPSPTSSSVDNSAPSNDIVYETDENDSDVYGQTEGNDDNDDDDEEYEDGYVDNWPPPWATTPASGQTESEIKVINNNDLDGGGRGRDQDAAASATGTTSGGKSRSSGTTVAVFYYVVPLLACLIGNALTSVTATAAAPNASH